ncbi:hypothetical protein GW17_00047435 [Ensete ventricosum]|nr:hypothetical protein GW17_00047435 [Ensete ventricosum]RZS20189.1 hypothetical protein BHM03_00052671 [Ensete ventricosum]
MRQLPLAREAADRAPFAASGGAARNCQFPLVEDLRASAARYSSPCDWPSARPGPSAAWPMSLLCMHTLLSVVLSHADPAVRSEIVAFTVIIQDHI